MAHNFRKNPEGMDLTPDADMRSTEEIEAEADKKALERPEVEVEMGHEHEDVHGDEIFDPGADLTAEQLAREAARIEKNYAEANAAKVGKTQGQGEEINEEVSDPEDEIEGENEDGTNARTTVPQGKNMIRSWEMKSDRGKETNAKDDKTKQRKANRHKRDIAA